MTTTNKSVHFNQKILTIGRKVIYHKTLDEYGNPTDSVETTVSCLPWQPAGGGGHGDWLVKLEGFTGGISVDHIQVILDEDEASFLDKIFDNQERAFIQAASLFKLKLADKLELAAKAKNLIDFINNTAPHSTDPLVDNAQLNQDEYFSTISAINKLNEIFSNA